MQSRESLPGSSGTRTTLGTGCRPPTHLSTKFGATWRGCPRAVHIRPGNRASSLADIRGSFGESAAAFRAFLDRFYRLGSRAILEHDGLVDKLVGDEIIGLFFGGITGQRHASAAVISGRALIRAAAQPDATESGPMPVGAAVHTGTAYVGTTGPEGAVTDFTALGDAVNTTARVASEAVAGELLVTIEAATEAQLDWSGLGERQLTLRGRSAPITVLSLTS